VVLKGMMHSPELLQKTVPVPQPYEDGQPPGEESDRHSSGIPSPMKMRSRPTTSSTCRSVDEPSAFFSEKVVLRQRAKSLTHSPDSGTPSSDMHRRRPFLQSQLDGCAGVGQDDLQVPSLQRDSPDSPFLGRGQYGTVGHDRLSATHDPSAQANVVPSAPCAGDEHGLVDAETIFALSTGHIASEPTHRPSSQR
jgi:hypothetical protein